MRISSSAGLSRSRFNPEELLRPKTESNVTPKNLRNTHTVLIL